MTNPNDSATGFAWSQEQQVASGLTIREYFAAMAMQALLSDPNITTTYSHYAENAVQAADALIAELNK
jgi:hypothetical protein